MVIAIAALLIAFGVGFGLGRVKNKAKLSLVSAEIAKFESSVSSEVKVLVAKVKSVL